MIYYSDQALNEIGKEKQLLFLAGSMRLEQQGDWRNDICNELGNKMDYLDPTARHYHSMNEEDLKEHVDWEFEAMRLADQIVLNFLPESKSPISLVELGLNITSKKLVVICPKKFYKYTYIHQLCNHHSVPLFETLKSATKYIERVV